MKLQRLEATLGKRLVERSPRAVRLTAAGSNFLVHARALMEAHDRALTSEPSAWQQLSLGISDHAAGPELVPLLARLHAVSPQLALSVAIGFSRNLLEAYDGGELEAVIVRQEGGRRGGGHGRHRTPAGITEAWLVKGDAAFKGQRRRQTGGAADAGGNVPECGRGVISEWTDLHSSGSSP